MPGLIRNNKTALSIVTLLFLALALISAGEALTVTGAILAWVGATLLVISGVVYSARFCLASVMDIAGRTIELLDQRRRVQLEATAETLRLQANQALALAAIEQVRMGAIYPSDLHAGKFAHLPSGQEFSQVKTQALPAPALPPKVDISQVIPRSGPSINALGLGIEATDSGLKPLISPLAGLVHVGVGGSSGWGKSVFLQCLALQIALAPELVQLALIDIEAQTFPPFATLGNDRLRYPLADNERDILAVLGDLRGEWHRRRQLYQQYPQAADLDSYNALTAQPLPPIVMMIDEINMLTDDREIMAQLVKLGQGTRKYGIYCILGGQDWNASSIPTKLRNNFSTRIQLKAMSKTQSRVMLEDSAAADIHEPGRAYAVLPGRELREIQTPYISMADIVRALTGVGRSTPPPTSPVQVQDEFERRVIEAAETAASWNQLHHQVTDSDKNVGGSQIEKYKNVLQKYGVSVTF